MLLEGFLEKLHVKSYFPKLVVGSAIAALTISLMSAVILDILGLSVNSGVPAALGATGAATYATRMRKEI